VLHASWDSLGMAAGELFCRVLLPPGSTPRGCLSASKSLSQCLWVPSSKPGDALCKRQQSSSVAMQLVGDL
jgi:hypothetical protein